MNLLLFGFGSSRSGGSEPAFAAVASTIQLAKIGSSAAQQFAQVELAVLSATIGEFGGHKYVNRPGADVRDVTNSSGQQVRIFGQSGSSSETPGHDDKIESFGLEQAQQPGTLMVFLQRSLRTVTARTVNSALIPDIVVVREATPGDLTTLKIDMYEVQSASQTPDELRDKLDNLLQSIPEPMRGDTDVLPPLG